MSAFTFNPQQLAYIAQHYNTSTQAELYTALKLEHVVKPTTFRTQLYANGYKRFNKAKWTPQQVHCLRDNLNYMGNAAIAAHINATCGAHFKEKQIDKKLSLLGLTRSTAGFKRVKKQYKEQGVYNRANKKKWEKTRAHEGATRIYKKNRKYIKANGTFTPAAPHYWRLKHGDCPAGYVVWHIDGDATNSDPSCANLELITMAESARRTAAVNTTRPESLKTAIKLINKLSKILKHEQK